MPALLPALPPRRWRALCALPVPAAVLRLLYHGTVLAATLFAFTVALIASGQRSARPDIASWLLTLVASILLAAHWRLRGALAGSAMGLSVFALLSARRLGAYDDPNLLLLTLVTITVAFVVGWLAHEHARTAALRRTIEEQRRQGEVAAVASRASEARFRSLLQNASDIVAVLDPAGVYRYVSPSIEQVLGFSPDELSGRSFFLSLIHI